MTRFKTVLGELWRAIRSSTHSYLVIVRGRSEGAGLARLSEISHGGPLNRLGLAVLTLSVAATAYLSIHAQRFPVVTAKVWEGERLGVPTPALYLSLFVISFAWAYLLAGAAAVGLGAYFLVAIYAAYYGLFAGLGLGGSVWFALIPIWLLILGGWVASSSRSQWRLPLLLLLSLMVAWLTYNSLGLKVVLPKTWGRFVLAGCYFALVANPWALRPRPFRPALAFFPSLALYAVLFAHNLRRVEADQVFENAFLSVHGLLGLVGLYWYWLGLDLLNSAQNLAEWVVETIRAWASPRVLALLIFAFWILWSGAAYLLAHGLPLGLVRLLVALPWGERLLRALVSLQLPIAFGSTLNYDLYLTVSIATVASVLGGLKKLPSERLLTLFGLSVAGFFAIWGYISLFFAFSAEGSARPFGFWPLLVFSGGMFWEILKVSPALASEARTRSLLFLGFLLLLGGISLLELSAKYALFERELSLNSFLGLLYLGLPYLLYTALYKSRRYTLIPPRHLVLLFALGMLSAIPCLALGKLTFAPILWLMVVWGAVWRKGRWDDPWDGPIYALAVALGFVVFYTHPIFIPIPAFTPWLAELMELQAEYGQVRIWPWQSEWWWILCGSVASALALGALLTRAHATRRRARVALLVLAPGIGIALLAGIEHLLLGAT